MFNTIINHTANENFELTHNICMYFYHIISKGRKPISQRRTIYHLRLCPMEDRFKRRVYDNSSPCWIARDKLSQNQGWTGQYYLLVSGQILHKFSIQLAVNQVLLSGLARYRVESQPQQCFSRRPDIRSIQYQVHIYTTSLYNRNCNPVIPVLS